VTVIVSGADLTLDEVVAVARRHEPVAIAPPALERMASARALADASLASGAPTYGLTTGLGVQKRATLDPGDGGFGRRQIAESRAGQGPPASPDAVRATMLVLANQLAGGTTCLRPLFAERLAQALNGDLRPAVRSLGSLGASDLAAMADLAHAVFADVDRSPGEGLALINSSAFGTGLAALALADATRLADAADVAGALALEGFAANPSVLHPAVSRARPDPTLARTLARLRELLDGSALWRDGAARNLQDPLTYRSTPTIQAAARTALEHALSVLHVELNAAQGNPLVALDEGLVLSASVYEVVALSAALDYVRIALASMLVAASERTVKLLDTPWSGLPTGLLAEGDPDLGLSILAVTAQSLAAEACLLAQPVSFALTSSAGAEGIEDRASHLPLSARRLAELVDHGEGVVAVELLVSAQAVDLRGLPALGAGTRVAYRRVRGVVPFMQPGDAPPVDADPVRALVHEGLIA